MKLSKREFLISSTLFVSGCQCADKDVKHMRPPGAISEADFLARCNRCHRCVQVCPTRVIFPASFKEGLVVANTPIISFKNSYCNSCLKCSLVCPTKALLPVTEGTLDIGVAVIVKDYCVAWDWTGCTVCVDKCPLKAIYLDELKRPVTIPEKCNGCGICQVSCPSTSLRVSIKGKGVVVKIREKSMPRREVSDG